MGGYFFLIVIGNEFLGHKDTRINCENEQKVNGVSGAKIHRILLGKGRNVDKNQILGS